MAQPVREVPESATNTEPERPQEGRDALESVLEEYGGDYADAAEYTDELENVLETAILVISSADDAEVDYVTDSMVTLVKAGDAISTEGTVALAESFGDNSEGFAEVVDDVVRLQQEGHLTMFLELAGTLAEPLDEDDAERLANTVGENAEELADVLDDLMALKQTGQLDALLELAATFSTLDADETTANALNDVLGAVGEAEEESEPMGLFGALGALRSSEARAGLGYVVEILKGLGRRNT
ncbi:DUF1641 domain-containing protein [Halarchaeum nitratireducens]|uniref:DUF1641 domain-containing protein n=1 Tax=Halarchaeum nitratireducens TaxID=489913 RepID=A0A830G9P8_9EURY|nr:DUF1641 domain-containing protein [Halarchaeum nitratireducens]GGN09031.1 hypothetical protein GCM10009021_05590 [Halarchaeum nitratireducens]